MQTPDPTQLKELSCKKQSVLGQFTSEDVSENNVQKGDHLVFPRGLYDHHGICIGHDKDKQPLIAEYTGPSSTIRGSSKVLSCSDGGALAIIKTTRYTYDELLKQKVYKRIWPQTLKYGVEEIVSRAEGKLGEQTYGLLENNCEHFVYWCICGLNVSPQVKEKHFWAIEIIYSLIWSLTTHGIKSFIIFIIKCLKKYAIKCIANFSDEIAGTIGATTIVGFAIAIVIELGFCACGIYNARRRWKKGECNETEQMKNKICDVVMVVAKCFFRLVLGIGGSAIGVIVVAPCFPKVPPVWLSLAFGMIGGILGHFIGYCISRCCQNRDSKVPVASEPATDRTHLIDSIEKNNKIAS